MWLLVANLQGWNSIKLQKVFLSFSRTKQFYLAVTYPSADALFKPYKSTIEGQWESCQWPAGSTIEWFIFMWLFYRLKIGVLVYLGEQKILMKKLIKKQW